MMKVDGMSWPVTTIYWQRRPSEMSESKVELNTLSHQLQSLLKSDTLAESKRGSDESKATLEKCWNLLGTMAEKDIIMRDEQFTASLVEQHPLDIDSKIPTELSDLNLEDIDDESLEKLVTTTVRNAGLEPQNYSELEKENTLGLLEPSDNPQKMSLEKELIYARCMADLEYLQLSNGAKSSDKKDLLIEQFKKKNSEMINRINNTSTLLYSSEITLKLAKKKSGVTNRLYIESLMKILGELLEEVMEEYQANIDDDITRHEDWKKTRNTYIETYGEWEWHYIKKKSEA